ncbi:MAG: CoA-binding protein [Rectinemataceae bacterium]|nr:CoA-binding protein [Rectinemataceae bacterium]
MNTRKDIDAFFTGKTFALAGISRSGQAMSNSVHKELTAKGFRILPVNPNTATVDGVTCYPSLASLPEKPDGVIIFTPKSQTAAVVREAWEAGINRIWIQQGALTPEAEAFCREKKLEAVCGRCIMMFAEPVGSVHAFHRAITRIFGRYPR